jgi:hypothetical protein
MYVARARSVPGGLHQRPCCLIPPLYGDVHRGQIRHGDAPQDRWPSRRNTPHATCHSRGLLVRSRRHGHQPSALARWFRSFPHRPSCECAVAGESASPTSSNAANDCVSGLATRGRAVYVPRGHRAGTTRVGADVVGRLLARRTQAAKGSRALRELRVDGRRASRAHR